MKISELIEQLKKTQEENGDLEVKVQTLSHMWSPEVEVRERGTQKYVLLNP